MSSARVNLVRPLNVHSWKGDNIGTFNLVLAAVKADPDTIADYKASNTKYVKKPFPSLPARVIDMTWNKDSFRDISRGSF
jgi:hypothetical protein